MPLCYSTYKQHARSSTKKSARTSTIITSTTSTPPHASQISPAASHLALSLLHETWETIIIEIRIFEPLNGVDDPDHPVTVSSVSGDRDVVERDYSLCGSYGNFKDLHMTNPHFVFVRDRERKVTRNWVWSRHDVDWAMAIEGLVKHKVQKLVIKPELGGLAVLRSRGRLLRAIEFVGDSQMVDNVEIILEGEVGRDVPRQVARRVASLRRQYGWD
jgi:hypothetical protein